MAKSDQDFLNKLITTPDDSAENFRMLRASHGSSKKKVKLVRMREEPSFGSSGSNDRYLQRGDESDRVSSTMPR